MGPSRLFPFRRALAIDPIVLTITPPGSALIVSTINKAAIQAAGVTSFKITNPNPFAVWYRGWAADTAMPTIYEMGHFLMPGATDVNTSQIPERMAVVPDDMLDFPIYAADGTTFLYAGKRLRCVMLYGSGM